ncbi:MAG: protein CapI, partial [Steroidobacteraceae bacterium]
VFNSGKMRRDFTHIDDIVAGVLGALDHASVDDGTSPPCAIYNLGNHQPVELERFIAVIEKAAGRKAQRIDQPMQPGDMPETSADVDRAHAAFGFTLRITIEQGMPAVVAWCRE